MDELNFYSTLDFSTYLFHTFPLQFIKLSDFDTGSYFALLDTLRKNRYILFEDEREFISNIQDSLDSEYLMEASEKGYLLAVIYLINKGLDVDTQNSYGDTALKIAAMYGQEEVVKWLIEKGANVNSIGSDDNTPLMVAGEYGYENVMKLLVENGANIDELEQ